MIYAIENLLDLSCYLLLDGENLTSIKNNDIKT